MKIIFDCRYTRIDRHDGISRFTAGLVTALSRLHPVTMLISDERQLAMLPDLPWVMGRPPTSLLEPFTARYLNRFQPDVVYTPMQTLGPWSRKFRLVTTVHDLIYYTNPTPPRELSWLVRLIWRIYHLTWAPQRFLLRRADAHVSVSETTRQLMVQHRLTPHPITIVPNAVDAPTAPRTEPPMVRELVYMGSFMPYKNVEFLARAMHLLPGYRLLLMSRISDEAAQRLERLGPPGSLVFLNGASDEDYENALRRATALVTASLDEGFGIPLIESMAIGTPVVVSDIPIFREIGDGAAVFFDPADTASFAAAVRGLEERKEWMRRSGLSTQRAEAFSWDRSAATLLEVLTETAARDIAR